MKASSRKGQLDIESLLVPFKQSAVAATARPNTPFIAVSDNYGPLASFIYLLHASVSRQTGTHAANGDHLYHPTASTLQTTLRNWNRNHHKTRRLAITNWSFVSFRVTIVSLFACLGGSGDWDTVRTYRRSRGSIPRTAGWFRIRIPGAHALRLISRAGKEGSTVSSVICDRWLILS